MIYSVTVKNYLGESLKLELAHPENSGFIVENIGGIGAGAAEVNTTELATTDGSLFNSARVTERNIVISLKFEMMPTIEDIRHKSYKYFPLKKPLTLTFETDTRICNIDGYVESNEPDVFSDKEGTEISIICPNPYFKATDTIKLTFFGVDPLFEFPFSNESLGEDLIEFGSIKRRTYQTINYDGDTETGVVIKMKALDNVRNITVYKLQTREAIRIRTDKLEELTGLGLVKGDELMISTVKKEQYVRLLRSGRVINVLNVLDRSSSWIQLTKGENTLVYAAEEGSANLEFFMEYNTLYAGV